VHHQELILNMKEQMDSVGGVIECIVQNCPPGIGSPEAWKIKGELASALMSINAVQGVEYGSGFRGAAMQGSQHNDEYCMKEGKIATRTNNHGGILGGITTGEDIVVRAAFKPVSSLPRTQNTVTQ
jgi:chorismate synthase